MGYTTGLILGSYGCCELAWELYLRVKEGGIHIRPNEEIVPSGTSDEDGRALWIAHCQSTTGENYKGYFIIQEDNVDKFKVYVGEFGSYTNYNRGSFYITSDCGLGGSITGSGGVMATYKSDIIANRVSVSFQGTSGVNHYTCIYMSSMNGTPIAYIPLSWYNNSFLKTEGNYNYNYNAHTFKKTYNHVVKIITNNTVKIIEISTSSRNQSISGHIVIGYIKGIGLTWITNEDNTNRNIGAEVANEVANDNSYQYYPTFYPNSTQVYMQHMLPYNYSENGIEYLTQKLFVSGQYPPSTKTIFQAYAAVDEIYDCNTISTVAVPGSRIVMDGIIYYVIENSIIPIGEVEE